MLLRLEAVRQRAEGEGCEERVRLEDREQGHQQDEEDDEVPGGDEAGEAPARCPRGHHAASRAGVSAPPASAVRFSTESPSRPTSAVTWPRLTISARWATPATSSKS